MATAILNGQTTWKMTRDEEGHRTYNITFRVRGLTTDGPANVLQTPGLPLYGSYWVFDDDVDLWAYCRWNADVRPVLEGEPNTEWTVDFVFSTKPDKCCRENQIDDPLLQPQEVSGGSVKYTEEATEDWRGDPILTSSLEQIRGPQNEWDANRSSIKVKQFVAHLDLAACNAMLDTVNDAPIWNFDKWTVKLSSFSWEKKYYGLCNVYYVRHFEFDVNIKRWARYVLDEGSKALNGHHGAATGEWVLDDIAGSPPDPTNPLHFKQYKDRAGENTRVILDGYGKPYIPPNLLTGTDVTLPEDQWWGILYNDGGLSPGTDPLPEELASISTFFNGVLKGTCTTAKNYARSRGGKLKGPWDTEAQAWASTRPPNTYAGATYPDDLECEDGSDGGPGKIKIDKYKESNFLDLALPTEI